MVGSKKQKIPTVDMSYPKTESKGSPRSGTALQVWSPNLAAKARKHKHQEVRDGLVGMTSLTGT